MNEVGLMIINESDINEDESREKFELEDLNGITEKTW